MSTFGSNLKENGAIKSANRQRPKVAVHSGYGQQKPVVNRIAKPSRNSFQDGKIKAFINLDDIPDDGYEKKDSAVGSNHSQQNYYRNNNYNNDDDDDDFSAAEERGGDNYSYGKIQYGAAAQRLISGDDNFYETASQSRRIIPKMNELKPMQRPTMVSQKPSSSPEATRLVQKVQNSAVAGSANRGTKLTSTQRRDEEDVIFLMI